MPKVPGGWRLRPSASTRIVLIFGALVLMVMTGHDALQRGQTDQAVADTAAADRDPPSKAMLQHEEIDGPEVVAAYFRQGYAWAEAHGIGKASDCPADNRPNRDGCRAYVARSKP
jgi:hypothetical protein